MKLQDIKKKIRKYKDILTVAGYGVIVFAAWSFLKGAILISWYFPNGNQLINRTLTILYIISTAVVLCLSLVCGWLASEVGKKDKKLSLATTISSSILLILVSSHIAFEIYLTSKYDEFDVASIIAFITDILFLFFVGRVLFGSIKLTQFTKIKLEAKE